MVFLSFFNTNLAFFALGAHVLSKYKKNIKTFSVEIFQLLKLENSLFIAWACFRNDNSVFVNNYQVIIRLFEIWMEVGFAIHIIEHME